MAEAKVFRASDFSAERPKVEVEIPSRKGVSVPMRAVSLGELHRLRAACGLAPTPPLKKNPDKGSLAAPEPDERDPAYLLERREWGHAFSLAQVALSMGYQPKGHSAFDLCDEGDKEKCMAAWVVDAVAELQEIFTDDDVAALIRGLRQANGEEVDPKKA